MADALGVEGVLTLDAGSGSVADARMYQMRSARARRRTTRFAATGHSYRLGIQDGDVMLRFFVPDSTAIPLPSASTSLTFTLKQSSSHTAHTMEILIYEIVKVGRSDDDSMADCIALGQITGTHT